MTRGHPRLDQPTQHAQRHRWAGRNNPPASHETPLRLEELPANAKCAATQTPYRTLPGGALDPGASCRTESSRRDEIQTGGHLPPCRAQVDGKSPRAPPGAKIAILEGDPENGVSVQKSKTRQRIGRTVAVQTDPFFRRPIILSVDHSVRTRTGHGTACPTGSWSDRIMDACFRRAGRPADNSASSGVIPTQATLTMSHLTLKRILDTHLLRGGSTMGGFFGSPLHRRRRKANLFRGAGCGGADSGALRRKRPESLELLRVDRSAARSASACLSFDALDADRSTRPRNRGVARRDGRGAKRVFWRGPNRGGG